MGIRIRTTRQTGSISWCQGLEYLVARIEYSRRGVVSQLPQPSLKVPVEDRTTRRSMDS